MFFIGVLLYKEVEPWSTLANFQAQMPIKYLQNKIGPKTVPCGTLHKILNNLSQWVLFYKLSSSYDSLYIENSFQENPQ